MLSDKDLLLILGQSSDACAVYDSEELNIRFVNEAMLQLFGKQADITGLTLEVAVPELQRQSFPALLKQVWKTGEVYKATDTEATLIVDGVPVTSHFSFIYRPLVDDTGKTYAILHTAKDVSARVRAEKELAEQQQRLQESETDFKRLIEQAPVAILVFKGADMVINQVNQAMLEILGKDNSIIGMPLLDGLPEIKGAPAVEQLFHVYHTGESSDGNEEPVPINTNGKVELRYFNFSYR
ncbi:MAG: PAS domain-containing protein, partial [Pedobacter sp.]